jgi:HNH endonuclease
MPKVKPKSKAKKGFCKCGCGQRTWIATQNHKKFGWVKGEPVDYIRGHNNSRFTGPANVSSKEKWCPRCETVKKLTEFSVYKTGKICGHCKKCRSEQASVYQRENKEKVNAKNRNWHHQEEDGVKKGLLAWDRKVARNPELYRQSARKRVLNFRAKAKEAFVEYVDPAKVYERDEGVCGICWEPVTKKEFVIDHKVPFSKGGLHEYDNVQIAHPECNFVKGNHILPE